MPIAALIAPSIAAAFGSLVIDEAKVGLIIRFALTGSVTAAAAMMPRTNLSDALRRSPRRWLLLLTR